MLKYYTKWVVASLIAPIIVAFTQSVHSGLVLVFWPCSIFLMSLGAEPRPITDVMYVWGVAIITNVLLYMLLAYVINLLLQLYRLNNDINQKL